MSGNPPSTNSEGFIRPSGRAAQARAVTTGGQAPAPAPLRDPDPDQIEKFTDALFRHARPGGFVSLRAFYETDSTKPFRIIPVAIGDSLRLLNDEAVINARLAANHPQGIVFCPPIAAFKDRKGAKESDIAEGLALSVECDEHPNEARERLTGILDLPTVVVASGGIWTDPATGEAHDKLHLHWRLGVPARRWHC
jgi:hypothetical protein